MSDREMVSELLQQTLGAVERIIKRFEPVDSADFFSDTSGGMEKLDAICMLLIAVGESLKRIDKLTSKSLLQEYPDVDWIGVKGMRDIISHHYFDVDAEEIFWVCENHLAVLAETLKKIIADIS
jgi:uncharacterized protein with HEPN domain